MVGKSFSHFKIIKKLGEGGMGKVYLAEDTKLHRKVALKFLPKEYSSDPNLKARFQREARAAAALNHPRIITIFDINEDGSYIAMEHVEGKSLRELIADGEVSLNQALDWMIQICEGIGVAHDNEIIHRDIKPANIMLDRYEQIKILDFGLAKQGNISRITRSGTTMGTPSYMCPEQVLGKELNEQADIYALGVLFYELLTNQVPFEGSNEMAIMYAIVNEKPKSARDHNPQVPRGWQKIIDKCLNKKLKARYQNVQALTEDLRKERQIFAQAGDVTKTSIKVLPKEPKGKSWAAVSSVLFLAVLAISFLVLFKGNFWSAGSQQTSGQPEQTPIAQRPEDKPVKPETSTGQSTRQSERPKTTEPKPQSLVGSLHVASEPEIGAFVKLRGPGGQVEGITPFTPTNLKAGSYRLEIRKPGYVDVNREITVHAGRLTPIKISMKQLMGSVSFVTRPKDVTVLIDGAGIGTTPISSHQIPIGQYRVLLRKDGFQDIEKPITVESAKFSLIDETLIALIGKLRFLARPHATIFVDGIRVGDEQDRWFERELNAGPHLVRAENPEHGIWQKQINIAPGKTTEVEFNFIEKFQFTVGVTPGWGELYVDGKRQGEAPQEIELKTGLHTIEIRRDGFDVEPGVQTINVDKDSKKRLVFKLNKK